MRDRRPCSKCECGCGAVVRQRFVSGHNRRGRHFPNEDYSTRKGKNHYRYQGGVGIRTDEYIIYHNKKGIGNHVYEHRLIMEKKLGRKLTPKELVHHINGNRRDNRPENLMVVTRGEHNRIHFKK